MHSVIRGLSDQLVQQSRQQRALNILPQNDEKLK